MRPMRHLQITELDSKAGAARAVRLQIRHIARMMARILETAMRGMKRIEMSARTRSIRRGAIAEFMEMKAMLRVRGQSLEFRLDHHVFLLLSDRDRAPHRIARRRT